MNALSYSAKKDANKMKTKSNRRGRRQRGYRGLLWVLAAGLLLFGLIAQQNILLGTSSRHALLMDARTGQVLARKRPGEEAAPASLTKMMTVLLATEALPDLDTPVTLPEDVFPALYKADASTTTKLSSATSDAKSTNASIYEAIRKKVQEIAECGKNDSKDTI